MEMGEQRVRIVAGELKGRRFDAPSGTATRPTSDRVREAMFSSLEAMGSCAGASVLDAFAGSGALSFEALSRGAHHATLVEKSRSALAVLKKNQVELGLGERVTLVAGDTTREAGRIIPGAPFSLLFLDPPYKLDQSEVRGIIENLIASGALVQDAVLVWEHSSGACPELPQGVSLIRERRYGDTTVTMAVVDGVGEVR